jgi:polar amino acid transport system ATP-binding protein
VAQEIGQACRAHGFFYVVGHAVDEALCLRAGGPERGVSSRCAEPTKMQWRMALAGRAWRGYFPLGGELTSGRPDWKEGLYIGAELDERIRWCAPARPVHRPQTSSPTRRCCRAFAARSLDYMAALTGLGHRLMEGIALSLEAAGELLCQSATPRPP